MIPALASQARPGPDARPAPFDVPRAPSPSTEAGAEHAPEFPPDIVLIVRAGGTVLYVNRPLGRRSEEEVVGSQFTDWVFPEQHAAVRDALARVFTTGLADGVELHGIQGHDAEAWFECRISPNQRDAKVVSVTIIARDVTRYKQTERGLREAYDETHRQLEERTADLALLRTEVGVGRRRRPEGADAPLQDAVQTAGEAIFLLDPATETVVDLNDTACRWLHRHRGELLGLPVAEIDIGFPLLPPVGFDVGFTETRDTRRPLTLDGEHRRQDGSTFPVEVTVISHGYDGREFYLAIARDVKDRRRAQEAIQEAEAQWRALFEQSFDAVYLTTRGGEVVEANPAALALFGYHRDEFLGLDARTLMPDVGDIRRFQHVMATERFVARLEATLRRRDGTSFPGVLSASRRRDARDRLLGYQWVVRQAESAPTAARPMRDATPTTPTSATVPSSRLPRFTPPEPLPAPPVPPEPATPSAEEPAPETEAVDVTALRRAVTTAPRPHTVAAPLGETPVEEGGRRTDRGVVLLVGGRAAGRREAVEALERAGFAVLDAADGTDAIRLLRSHDAGVDVAVVAGEPGVEPEDIARDLEALTQGLALVLVRSGNRDQAPPADLPEAMVLREPVHPLTLLQVVREARRGR